MRKHIGFTLIELLVLIMIISVIIMISTPRFSSTYKSLKLKSETEKLAGYLHYISNKAIQDQKTYTVILESDPFVFRLENAEGLRFTRYKVDPSFSLMSNLDTVSFFPSGTISTCSIILSDSSGNSYEIAAEENTNRIQIFYTQTHYDQ